MVVSLRAAIRRTTATATNCYNGSGAYAWPGQTVSTGLSGVGTPPATDTMFAARGSYTYLAQGASRVGYSSADGSARWPPVSPFGSTIPNAVTPVKLTAGSEVIFVAAQDGRLWKIDAATPSTQTWVDTRRSTSGA